VFNRDVHRIGERWWNGRPALIETPIETQFVRLEFQKYWPLSFLHSSHSFNSAPEFARWSLPPLSPISTIQVSPNWIISMSPHQEVFSSSSRSYVDTTKSAKKSKKRTKYTPVKTAPARHHPGGAVASPVHSKCPQPRDQNNDDDDDDDDDDTNNSRILYYSRVTTYRLRMEPQHSPLFSRRLTYRRHYIDEV
jgi:hypothetical protein